MDDYDAILSEVNRAESMSSAGSSTTTFSGDVGHTAHVRALLVVLDSMAPKFHVEPVRISYPPFH